jgi:hypothetical protein
MSRLLRKIFAEFRKIPGASQAPGVSPFVSACWIPAAKSHAVPSCDILLTAGVDRHPPITIAEQAAILAFAASADVNIQGLISRVTVNLQGVHHPVSGSFGFFLQFTLRTACGFFCFLPKFRGHVCTAVNCLARTNAANLKHFAVDFDKYNLFQIGVSAAVAGANGFTISKDSARLVFVSQVAHGFIPSRW